MPKCNFMGVCYKQRKTYQNYPHPITTAHLSNLKIVKLQFFYMTLTFKVMNAMMLIARRSLSFTALQFVAITRYTVSLRLAKKKQQRTLNTIQLRTLG